MNILVTVAQLVERPLGRPEVVGSNPGWSLKFSRCLAIALFSLDSDSIIFLCVDFRFESETYTAWVQKVEQNTDFNLNKPIITRDEETNHIAVNFDPQVINKHILLRHTCRFARKQKQFSRIVTVESFCYFPPLQIYHNLCCAFLTNSAKSPRCQSTSVVF